MSISTMRGDGGQTSLAGGVRVSKASARVETYGTIDELNSALGFARSICGDEAIAELTHSIQKELFPKYKQAQAEGKDLGVAGEEFKAGQEAMRNGLTDEALEHFKKAKAAWPAQ